MAAGYRTFILYKMDFYFLLKSKMPSLCNKTRECEYKMDGANLILMGRKFHNVGTTAEKACPLGLTTCRSQAKYLLAASFSCAS